MAAAHLSPLMATVNAMHSSRSTSHVPQMPFHVGASQRLPSPSVVCGPMQFVISHHPQRPENP